MDTDPEPLLRETVEKNTTMIFKSSEDIMKNAVFHEIITCVEHNGVILTLLQGSKKIQILQEVVNLLQDVRVLSLTQDVCRVLISHQMKRTKEYPDKSSSSGLENKTSIGIKTSKSSIELSPEESVKNALFDEVVQAVIQNECSLIMATGLKSVDKLQKAVEILGNARIIYLAPDACDMLLVNTVEGLGKKKTKGEKTFGRSVSEDKTCHLCNKKFSKRGGLLTHQKALHEKYLPHKCDLCNKAFVYPKELRVHKLSHTGLRPYHCEVCKKGFISRKDLERHHPVHTGVRAFVCTICRVTFAHKANLDRHVKCKHEGQRPYVCSLCVNKKYCDRGGLRKHLASVHRIFDIPRKQVTQRMIETDEKDAAQMNVQDSNLREQNVSHGDHVTHDHINDSLTSVVGITKELSSSLTETPHQGITAETDSTTIESASKILQQLGQNVAAELSRNTSASLAGKTDDPLAGTMNDMEQSLSERTVSKTAEGVMGSVVDEDITTRTIINIAFNGSSLDGHHQAWVFSK